MARSLLPREFYKELSYKINESPDKTQYICENMVDFIIDELMMYSEIRFPNLGTFYSKYVPPMEKIVPVKAGSSDVQKILCKETYRVSLKLSEGFTTAVRGEKCSKAESKRQKALAQKALLQQEEYKKQIENVQRAEEVFQKALDTKKQNYLKRHGKIKDIEKEDNKIEKEICEDFYYEDDEMEDNENG